MDEQLIDLLLERGLTEEQIDQIAALSGLGTEMDILGRQRLQAQNLLGRQMPGARTHGDIFRHAHPTEFLGTLGSRMLGAYRDTQLNERQRGISGQQVAGRQALLRALLGQSSGVGGGGMAGGMAQASTAPGFMAGSPRPRNPNPGMSRTRLPDLSSRVFRSTGHPGF